MIPNNEAGIWWLATPFCTRSPHTGRSVLVWNVYSDGDCSYYWYYNTYGVRPALVLNSSLLVSYEGEEDIDLTKVQNEAFLEEAKRRWKQGMFTIQINGPYIDFEGV